MQITLNQLGAKLKFDFRFNFKWLTAEFEFEKWKKNGN